MSHIWLNQQLFPGVQDVPQGFQTPEYTSQNNQTHKPRAYVNPQIVNCDFITRSIPHLPTGNKIHVNPNFKGKGLSNLQQQQHNSQLQLDSSSVQTLSNQDDNLLKNETAFGVEKSESGLVEKTYFKTTSRFKKINNAQPKNIKSRYTWSKESSCKQTPTCSFRKLKSDIFPSYSYKYTIPKKDLKIVNSMKKPLIPYEASPPIYPLKTKIVNKSKMKLVNKPLSGIKSKVIKMPSPIKQNSSKSVYSKYKKLPIVRVANLVKNKYKYFKTGRPLKHSKYKIDKRKKLPEINKKKISSNEIQDIRKLFPKNFYSMIKLPLSNIHTRTQHTWRKNGTTEKISQRKRSNFHCRKVVKIGGILYKSTVNKLIVAGKDHPTDTEKLLNTSNKSCKVKKRHVLYVRGEKFVLGKNGKTLTRQPLGNEKSKPTANTLKRIDIGGVTYVKKSQNVLVRTNVHKARYLVNKAKQKSIALLTNLHKRTTMPCMIFHKFGKCIRHTKGLCIYKHDPKNIAICKKFMKGKCEDEKCLLSHQMIQEKMATCRFFLTGLCNRENCPFPHVKLSKKAAICEKFLQGFCPLGKDCPKRHYHQCPQFEKHGTCSQGSKCHYPHKTFDKKKESLQDASDKELDVQQENQSVQYFKLHIPLTKQKLGKSKKLLKSKDNQNKKGLKQQKKTKRKSENLEVGSVQADDIIECVPKRVKLDKLPCFIPLKSD